MSVSEIETAFSARLEQFSQLAAKLKFDFGDDRLFIDGTVTPATISHADDAADCTLKITAEDLLKVMHGQLDPTMAFMTGKLKVQGSTAIAMKLSSVLK